MTPQIHWITPILSLFRNHMVSILPDRTKQEKQTPVTISSLGRDSPPVNPRGCPAEFLIQTFAADWSTNCTS
jgi:hypothetical protein